MTTVCNQPDSIGGQSACYCIQILFMSVPVPVIYLNSIIQIPEIHLLLAKQQDMF